METYIAISTYHEHIEGKPNYYTPYDVFAREDNKLFRCKLSEDSKSIRRERVRIFSLDRRLANAAFSGKQIKGRQAIQCTEEDALNALVANEFVFKRKDE